MFQFRSLLAKGNLSPFSSMCAWRRDRYDVPEEGRFFFRKAQKMSMENAEAGQASTPASLQVCSYLLTALTLELWVFGRNLSCFSSFTACFQSKTFGVGCLEDLRLDGLGSLERSKKREGFEGGA